MQGVGAFGGYATVDLQKYLVLYGLLKISCCLNAFVAGVGLRFASRRSVAADVAASQLVMLTVQGRECRRTLLPRGPRQKAMCISCPPAELHHQQPHWHKIDERAGHPHHDPCGRLVVESRDAPDARDSEISRIENALREDQGSR
jgi:hypothetical protein